MRLDFRSHTSPSKDSQWAAFKPGMPKLQLGYAVVEILGTEIHSMSSSWAGVGGRQGGDMLTVKA